MSTVKLTLEFRISFSFYKNAFLAWGCGSVGEHLPSMHYKALGSIRSAENCFEIY
jgi:hypothetical protein